MRRTLLSLCAALAVLSVAVGGAHAAGITDTTTPSSDDGDGGDVGICLVGADSPCNDAEDTSGDASDSEDANESEAIDGEDSEDGQMWIPEDQNRDGDIDDRFKGNDSDRIESGTDSETEAGICLVGADSPCNGDSGGDQIGTGDDAGNSDEQIWIPEDQNRDGQIDDRFRSDEVAAAFQLIFSVF
jgi:hypothetical protein